MFTSNTPEFRNLVRRICVLKRRLLPLPNDTATYTDEEYDLTAAFILMAHAEFEGFLESRCSSTVSAVDSAWATDRRSLRSVSALLAFEQSGAFDPDKTNQGMSQIATRFETAKRAYSNRLHNNHGIKSKDVYGLLIPIGLLDHEIPVSWIADLDTLGSIRGDHAHQQVGSSTRQDPKETKQLVARVLLGFRNIDLKLKNLASEKGSLPLA